MVAEEWSMRQEALVKDRNITRGASTTCGCISKNTIVPELSQIQPLSLYLDSVKCTFDENTKAAWVSARYKCAAKKVKPGPMSDGSTPDAGLNWRGRVIAQAVPIPGPWYEWCIPKISHRTQGGRLTPERSREPCIGSILRPKKQDAVLGMLSNREYALSLKWAE